MNTYASPSAQAAANATDEFKPALERAKQVGKDVTAFVKTDGKEMLNQVSSRATELSKELSNRVTERPLAAVGVAVAVGALAAMLVARR